MNGLNETLSPVQQAVATQEAVEELQENLIEEVFEHAQEFVGANGQLKHYSIFRWLLEVEQESGIVSEATMGSAGSKWLLAQRLGETLQSSIDQIVSGAAADRAYNDVASVFMLSNMMDIWRMNNRIYHDILFSDLVNPLKMQGYE